MAAHVAAHVEVEGVLRNFVKLATQGSVVDWKEVYFVEAVQLRVAATGVERSLVGEDGPTPAAQGSTLEVIDISIDGAAMAFALLAGERKVSLCLLKVGQVWRTIVEMWSEDEGTFATADFVGACAGATKYLSSNRAGDPAGMAAVFNPVARLTFTTGEDLTVISQEEFCKMVASRFTNPKHAPYAHLREDPRVMAHDSIYSVQFVGPTTAVVKLTVAFPPVLYYDLLFFALLPTTKTWCIIAKSSVHVPFLEDERAP